MSESEAKPVPVPEGATPVDEGAAPAAEGAEGEKKLTKSQIKAMEKAAKKAEQEAKLKAEQEAKLKALEAFKDTFCHRPLIQSTVQSTHVWREIKSLSADDVGATIHMRARIHTSRCKGKVGFLVFRQTPHSIQGVLAVDNGNPKEMVTFAGSLAIESVVDIEAKVIAASQPIVSTSQSTLELQIAKLFCVSASAAVLPFQIEDAQRGEAAEGEEAKPTVRVETRLECRWLDMRTKASNAVFRIQSRVGQYFRQFMLDRDYVEIHSPKMIGAASEGGANVFKLNYFGRNAYLAQSPQLYKQMALQGDLEGVFEVGPVFRAENSNTHRHLTEFVGLDFEMQIKEHYYEVLNVGEEMFHYMFTKLATHTTELAAVCEQYPFEPFVFQVPEDKIEALGIGIIEEGIPARDEYGALIRNRTNRMLRLEFPKAVALLNTTIENKMSETDDINTENEKRLGQLVKARYGVDFFISDKYPSVVRPFYTMPCPVDPRFSNSYDMFMRGEEISSGAQRVHDPEMLLRRGEALGVDMALVKDYVDSFRLGAWPHGGFGIGLERVVMLYLGLKNVRNVSLFPRDPQRITP